MENARITDGAVKMLDNIVLQQSTLLAREAEREGTASSDQDIKPIIATETIEKENNVTQEKMSLRKDGVSIQKNKRKHRRGKPKSKHAIKPYKRTNWKFQMPKNSKSSNKEIFPNANGRVKLVRSRSLVPYNTNKFLMEEHLPELPSTMLTPSGRTRDSSFSVDSEDNYLFSLPINEEDFLSKEFANVYERARVERLENLTKQQLIEECLQIEDRYSDQGRQQHLRNIQNISAEFMSKIRSLEEKIRDLSRENYDLRCHLLNSSAENIAENYNTPPMPMDSTSSEDSESDSSSSSSNSKHSSKSFLSEYHNVNLNAADDNTAEREQPQNRVSQIGLAEMAINCEENGLSNGYQNESGQSN